MIIMIMVAMSIMRVRTIMMNTSSNHTEGSTREDVGIVGLAGFEPFYIQTFSATVVSTVNTVSVLSVQFQYCQYKYQFHQ